MKTSKKSAVGRVVVCMLFDGESSAVSSDLSAENAVSISPGMIANSDWKIASSGFENGF